MTVPELFGDPDQWPDDDLIAITGVLSHNQKLVLQPAPCAIQSHPNQQANRKDLASLSEHNQDTPRQLVSGLSSTLALAAHLVFATLL